MKITNIKEPSPAPEAPITAGDIFTEDDGETTIAVKDEDERLHFICLRRSHTFSPYLRPFTEEHFAQRLEDRLNGLRRLPTGTKITLEA